MKKIIFYLIMLFIIHNNLVAQGYIKTGIKWTLTSNGRQPFCPSYGTVAGAEFNLELNAGKTDGCAYLWELTNAKRQTSTNTNLTVFTTTEPKVFIFLIIQ